jgi:prevent-host-death family protein
MAHDSFSFDPDLDGGFVVRQNRQQMKTATVRQAQHHLSKLLEALEDGEEIVITRRGKGVGKLVPMEPKKDPFDQEVDWPAWVAEQREWLKRGPVLDFNPVLAERESYER